MKLKAGKYYKIKKEMTDVNLIQSLESFFFLSKNKSKKCLFYEEAGPVFNSLGIGCSMNLGKVQFEGMKNQVVCNSQICMFVEEAESYVQEEMEL